MPGAHMLWMRPPQVRSSSTELTAVVRGLQLGCLVCVCGGQGLGVQGQQPEEA